MTSPVIVGFDGSAPSRAAVDFGAAEAERRNRPLHLCHAFTWPLLYPMADPADALPDHGPRVRSLELLNETADEVRRARPGLSVAARLLDGSPGGVLVSASADAGLLVVGHRGLGGFTGLLAGSVGVQVAGHARCPVVVVRGAPVADGAPIVVGVDGSAGAHLAAVAAFEQAQQQGVELFHLQVCVRDPTARSTDTRAGGPVGRRRGRSGRGSRQPARSLPGRHVSTWCGAWRTSSGSVDRGRRPSPRRHDRRRLARARRLPRTGDGFNVKEPDRTRTVPGDDRATGGHRGGLTAQ